MGMVPLTAKDGNVYGKFTHTFKWHRMCVRRLICKHKYTNFIYKLRRGPQHVNPNNTQYLKQFLTLETLRFRHCFIEGGDDLNKLIAFVQIPFCMFIHVYVYICMFVTMYVC